jgi:hypothetical protein
MLLGGRQLGWLARPGIRSSTFVELGACGKGLDPSLDSSPTGSKVGAMRFFQSLLKDGARAEIADLTEPLRLRSSDMFSSTTRGK